MKREIIGALSYDLQWVSFTACLRVKIIITCIVSLVRKAVQVVVKLDPVRKVKVLVTQSCLTLC